MEANFCQELLSLDSIAVVSIALDSEVVSCAYKPRTCMGIAGQALFSKRFREGY